MKKGLAFILAGFTIIATAWGIEYLPTIETAYFQAKRTMTVKIANPTEQAWVHTLKDEWMDTVYAEYHDGKPHQIPAGYDYGPTWRGLNDHVKSEMEAFFAKAWGQVLKDHGET